MADRFAGSIKIGGRLKRSCVEQLCGGISADGSKLDWGDACFNPQGEAELLAALYDGRLWLCNEEATWGEFEETEEVCRRLGLSYTRLSAVYGEIDSERVDWRTGMKEPLVRLTDADGREVVVKESQVRRALAALWRGNPAKAERLLAKLCIDVPEAPPFEIV